MLDNDHGRRCLLDILKQREVRYMWRSGGGGEWRASQMGTEAAGQVALRLPNRAKSRDRSHATTLVDRDDVTSTYIM